AITVSASSNTLDSSIDGTLFVRFGTPLNANTEVTLISSDPSILTVPASVTFNQGETLKTVPLRSSQTNTGNVVITARFPISFGGGVATVNIN
ncbi:hypothetical protein, partial [Citrobacter freundii]|uniref:hypothetical protein n=1 Tax=Citrobacter freundii TaxID=546 RepID=UPI0020013B22